MEDALRNEQEPEIGRHIKEVMTWGLMEGLGNIIICEWMKTSKEPLSIVLAS